MPREIDIDVRVALCVTYVVADGEETGDKIDLGRSHWTGLSITTNTIVCMV